MSAAVMTVDEVAALLKVHRKTVYEAIKFGDIPGVVRVGRVIRLHGPTVLAWLEKGESLSKTRKRR